MTITLANIRDSTSTYPFPDLACTACTYADVGFCFIHAGLPSDVFPRARPALKLI